MGEPRSNIGARATCNPVGENCDRPWWVCAHDPRCVPDLGLTIRERPYEITLDESERTDH
jgi:hypothetical protein